MLTEGECLPMIENSEAFTCYSPNHIHAKKVRLLRENQCKGLHMAYVLRNQQGQIIAASTDDQITPEWQEIDQNNAEYLSYIETSLKTHDAFRESDIQLARVLEDLIGILIERNLIQFTDFPSAAQKRLNDRQSMRSKNRLSMIFEDDKGLF